MQRVAFPPKSNSKSPVEANIDIIIKTSNLKMKEFLMKKQENEKEKNAHYLRREFSYSKYEQTLILPDDVDRDKIAARVSNGVLTVTLPKLGKQEQKLSRSIEVG